LNIYYALEFWFSYSLKIYKVFLIFCDTCGCLAIAMRIGATKAKIWGAKGKIFVFKVYFSLGREHFIDFLGV